MQKGAKPLQAEVSVQKRDSECDKLYPGLQE